MRRPAAPLALCCLLPALLVASGAGEKRDEPWWAYVRLDSPAVPACRLASWPRTPVDAFILARLEREDLAPSGEAGRRALLRRVSYDLGGLPPSPEEVEAFLADVAPDAHERVVERLLGAPRHGERWGRHWLDTVHFGETHGFDKDKPRANAWPYRDYVIGALNADKPYPRFVEEQLAGDVLHPDEPEAVVATGFIASGPWDFVGHVELREGTVDKAITRSLDRDDMVMTAMSTFVSTTVHCARCHDHKFDPIPQVDYYRLQAVFAGVERADRPHDADSESQRRRNAAGRELEALEKRERGVEEALSRVQSAELEALDARLGRLRAALPPPAGAGGAGGKSSSPSNGYHSLIEPTPDAVKWVQVDLGATVSIGTGPAGRTSLDAVRLVPARPVDFPDTPGFGFPLRFRVETADDPEMAGARVLLDRSGADFPSPGDAAVEIPGAGAAAGRYVRVTATRLWKRTDDHVFALAELEVVSGGRNLAAGAPVTALDSIEAGLWSKRHLVDGYSSRRRLGTAAEAARAEARRAELQAEIDRLAAEREAAAAALLPGDVRRERDEVRARREEARRELASLPPPGMVYAAARTFRAEGSFTPAPVPRPIHVLHRGNVQEPGEIAPPGALALFPELEEHFRLEDPADEGARRAALARWIVDRRNPLAWRSIANRIWQYHFGRGLADTPNDFGRMGSRPTHPELLDWLAAGLRDGDGSLKRLHRLLVTSAAYRQASVERPGPARRDGSNLLLWRMNRSRLEAEALRDAVLASSGDLDLDMGGPSDRQFFFKDDHSPVYDYRRFEGDSPAARRRGVYRFIVRSVPDPFLECLDCPDASLLAPQRYTTLTAQQSLALLNNPFMARQAERFAARLAREVASLERRVEGAYLIALGRPPGAEELEVMSGYAREHGLASVCRLMFNLNEFIFID